MGRFKKDAKHVAPRREEVAENDHHQFAPLDGLIWAVFIQS